MLGYLSERCRLLRGNVEYPYLLYGVKSMEEIYQVEVTPSEHLRKEGKIK